MLVSSCMPGATHNAKMKVISENVGHLTSITKVYHKAIFIGCLFAVNTQLLSEYMTLD